MLLYLYQYLHLYLFTCLVLLYASVVPYVKQCEYSHEYLKLHLYSIYSSTVQRLHRGRSLVRTAVLLKARSVLHVHPIELAKLLDCC